VETGGFNETFCGALKTYSSDHCALVVDEIADRYLDDLSKKSQIVNVNRTDSHLDSSIEFFNQFSQVLEMLRKSIVILFAALMMPTGISFAQSSDYGNGVHLYFGGRHQEAITALNTAIADDSDDARAYYFRGLARLASGNSYLAESDFQYGAMIETAGAKKPSRLVSRSLERIQGATRMRLEKIRRNAIAMQSPPTANSSIATTASYPADGIVYGTPIQSAPIAYGPIVYGPIVQEQIIQQPVIHQQTLIVEQPTYPTPIYSAPIYSTPNIDQSFSSAPQSAVIPQTVVSSESQMAPSVSPVAEPQSFGTEPIAEVAPTAIESIPVNPVAAEPQSSASKTSPASDDFGTIDLTQEAATPANEVPFGAESKAADLLDSKPAVATDRAAASEPEATVEPNPTVESTPIVESTPFDREPVDQTPLKEEMEAEASDPFGTDAPSTEAAEEPGAIETSVSETPANENPTSDDPFAAETTETEPASPAAMEEPKTEAPTTSDPFGAEPTATEPASPAVVEEPEMEEPASNDPFATEPTANETPAATEPATEAPASEAPAADPFGPEPKADEPAGEDPFGAEPATETPTAEPASETPASGSDDPFGN